MSSTSSRASWRCSRALSWMRRSVAMRPISASTSAASRSGARPAAAAGSSRARHSVRSSITGADRRRGGGWRRRRRARRRERPPAGGRKWVRRGRSPAPAEQGAAAWRTRPGRLRRCRPSCRAAARSRPRAPAPPRRRGTGRAPAPSGSPIVGRLARLARQVGDDDVEPLLQRLLHLRPRQAAGQAGAVQHQHRPRRLQLAAAAAPAAAARRGRRRAWDRSPARADAPGRADRDAAAAAERHVGDDEIVAPAQCAEQRRRRLGVDSHAVPRASPRRPARAAARAPAGRRARRTARRSGPALSSAMRRPGPALASSSMAALPRCRSGSSSSVCRRATTPKCQARLAAIVVAPTPPRTPVTVTTRPPWTASAARLRGDEQRREMPRDHVARERLVEIFERAQAVGHVAVEVDVVLLADHQHARRSAPPPPTACRARSAAAPRR